MEDLESKIATIEQLPIPILLGAGAGIATYFGAKEFFEYLQEQQIFLYLPSTVKTLALMYGGTVFQEVMLNYGRIRHRKIFHNFFKRSKEDPRQTINDIGVGILSGGLATPPTLVMAGKMALQRRVERAALPDSGTLTITLQREDMLPIIFNTALFAAPFGYFIYRVIQRKQTQTAQRAVALYVGTHLSALSKAKGAVEQYKKASQYYSSQFLHFSIAREQARLGNIEDAALSIYQGYQSQNEEPALQSGWGRKWFVMGLASDYRKILRKLKKNPSDLHAQLQQIILHAMVDNKQQLLTGLERLVSEQREHEDRQDLQLLYAITLAMYGDHDQARQQLVSLLDTMERREQGFKQLGDSVNEVFEYQPNKFIKNVAVFKRGQKDAIHAEAKITAALEEMLRQRPQNKVPKVLIEVEKADKAYLLMERGHGKSLEEIDKTDVYLQAADFLAYFHAHIPHSLSAKGKVDIIHSTRERLQNPHLGLEEKIVNDIIKNFMPVYGAVREMPYGFNCDAHPGNWMHLEDGSLLALDKEDKGIVPVGFDIANLSMGRKDMDTIIEAYWKNFINYAKMENKDKDSQEQFRLQCFNSVIYRAIAFTAAWSSPTRPRMHTKRSWALEHAMDTITKIRDRYETYYREHQQAYGALQQLFFAMRITLDPALRA
ncbi:hypothetical protein HY488_02560 [Candidatus Woesearchaeota archaeon]|nr:hypothetical protein [Candidatus Woesearchaeota archaeon]